MAYGFNDDKSKATLAAVATSGAYNDLSGKPNLASVATSGNYNDLSNKPTVPSVMDNLDSNISNSALSARQGYILGKKYRLLHQSTIVNAGGLAFSGNPPYSFLFTMSFTQDGHMIDGGAMVHAHNDGFYYVSAILSGGSTDQTPSAAWQVILPVNIRVQTIGTTVHVTLTWSHSIKINGSSVSLLSVPNVTLKILGP